MQLHFPFVGKPAGLVLKSSYMFAIPSGGKNYIDFALWDMQQRSFGMLQENSDNLVVISKVILGYLLKLVFFFFHFQHSYLLFLLSWMIFLFIKLA